MEEEKSALLEREPSHAAKKPTHMDEEVAYIVYSGRLSFHILVAL